MKALSVFTIGHSTHPIEAFIEILRAHGIERLIDIRTIPRSRYNSQFNREDLSVSLHNQKIDYRHMAKLGGLRHARKDSILNTGWRNASFRGYADYMQTQEFEEGLATLIKLAKEKCTAIMCAESVPWRCHRLLVADALVAQGVAAHHIMSKTNAAPHTLNPMAVVQNGKVTYPNELARSLGSHRQHVLDL
jgi:uncharacterized protein (DUF488 family)